MDSANIRPAWLMKSEPGEFSAHDLAASPGQCAGWFGVRNHQARNFMRDQAHVGDLVFFYHSSCPRPGIAALARIASPAYPDPTQFDPASPYFDPAATVAKPRWYQVDVRLERLIPLLPLEVLRQVPDLATMLILRKGNRLSITPVSPQETAVILSLVEAS